MNIKKINFTNLSISIIMVSVAFIFTTFLFDPVYSLNDDVMINDCLSGKYSGSCESMTYYFSIPLAFIISLFYKIAPSISWYASYLMLSCFFSFGIICYRALAVAENFKSKIISSKAYIISALSLIFLIIFLPNTAILHYTLVAAISAGSGIFLLITSKYEETGKANLINNIFSIILMCNAYLIRENVFFMMLPFFAIAGLYKLFCHGFSSIKNYISTIIVFTFCFSMLFVINKIPYMSDSWKEYVEYNDARTELYDYVKIKTDEDSINYYNSQSISQAEFDLYRSYNIMLADKDLDLIQKFINYKNVKNEKTTFFDRLKNVIYIYLVMLKGSYNVLNYVLIALYLIIAFSSIKNKNYKTLLVLVSLFILKSFIWIYLILKGRFPERISCSLIYLEMLLLVAILIEIAKKIKYISLNNLVNAILIIIMIYSASEIIPSLNSTYDDLVETNTKEDILFDYMKKHPDNLYLMDVYASVSRTEYAFREYDSSYNNYAILGGWMTQSPLYYNKMKYHGYNSAKEALLSGDNNYLVIRADSYNGINIDNYSEWLECNFIMEDIVESEDLAFWIYKADL